MKRYIAISSLIMAFAVSQSHAATSVKMLNSKYSSNLPAEKVIRLVEQHFDISQYREVKAQVMYDKYIRPESILVYLFAKNRHRVEFAKMNIDQSYQFLSVVRNYHVSKEDADQQIKPLMPVCPDNAIEFIAFAPNDDELEQKVTIDVADAALKHELKTVSLLKDQATTANYLNYMKCPKLKGNFYDGDADPEAITTVDGFIYASDINEMLNKQWNYKVTNIWLACEAFNDPMKTTMLDVAQSQKYAAGVNDLLVGPSDYAAACAMKAGMDHHPMTASFQQCYKEYDNPEDIWGFDGKGSDYFGS